MQVSRNIVNGPKSIN